MTQEQFNILTQRKKDIDSLQKLLLYPESLAAFATVLDLFEAHHADSEVNIDDWECHLADYLFTIMHKNV